MTTNYINQSTENEPIKKQQAAKNTIKMQARKAIIPLLVTGAIFTANEAKWQSWQLADAKYYSLTNPDTIPNLNDQTIYKLTIKAWERLPITMWNDMIPGSTTYLRWPNDTGGWVSVNRINDLQNDVIYIDKVWNRERDYRKKSDGKINHIGIQVNYQADTYDRTPWSSTQNQRPEVIMVDAGQQATLSAGPNMNPTWDLLHSWYYKRKNINDASYTWSPIDSVRNISHGTYVSRTNDGTGTWTNDTIAVVERPSANNSARTLNFAATVNGVIYKVYKFQPAAAGAPMSKAPSENAVDSAWVEVPSLSFVGDGNPRSVWVELGTYRIGAQRTANTAVQQDTKSIKVDLGTDVLEVNTEEKNTFKQANRELSRATEVPSIIYNIHGQEMGTALASTIRIPDQATAWVYIVRFTENGKIHTKKIVIR